MQIYSLSFLKIIICFTTNIHVKKWISKKSNIFDFSRTVPNIEIEQMSNLVIVLKRYNDVYIYLITDGRWLAYYSRGFTKLHWLKRRQYSPIERITFPLRGDYANYSGGINYTKGHNSDLYEKLLCDSLRLLPLAPYGQIIPGICVSMTRLISKGG